MYMAIWAVILVEALFAYRWKFFPQVYTTDCHTVRNFGKSFMVCALYECSKHFYAHIHFFLESFCCGPIVTQRKEQKIFVFRCTIYHSLHILPCQILHYCTIISILTQFEPHSLFECFNNSWTWWIQHWWTQLASQLLYKSKIEYFRFKFIF